MIHTLAFSNYRSVQDLVMPLDNLNLVTGSNGSGKSNIYKALRLLAEAANGGGINALAREGGLDSTFWAGPSEISNSMRNETAKVEGNHPQKVKRLKLGFASDDFSYSVSLGITPPLPYPSAFNLDPEIKRESIWHGLSYRPASALIERKESIVKAKKDKQWHVLSQHLPLYESIFTQIADPVQSPEVILLREFIKNWFLRPLQNRFRRPRQNTPIRHSHTCS